MTYKSVKLKAAKQIATFTMGKTRRIHQRNGVVTTVTRAMRDDGMTKTDVDIFANGRRVERIADHVEEGMTSSLVGKYSQPTVFVALDVAQ